MSVKSWIKENWRGIASGVCAVAAAGTFPVSAPVALGIAGFCGWLASSQKAQTQKKKSAGATGLSEIIAPVQKVLNPPKLPLPPMPKGGTK